MKLGTHIDLIELNNFCAACHGLRPTGSRLFRAGQSNLKAFVMLNCEDLEFSLKGVSLAASQISMSRHGNTSCCNSAI